MVVTDKPNPKKSLVFVFTVIAAIVVALFLLLSAWFGWRYYTSRIEAIELRLETQAARLERSLSDTISTAAIIANYIGGLLQQHTEDPTAIAAILHASAAQNELLNTTLTLSMFSWVNSKYQLTVSSDYGALSVPKDLSKRGYLPYTKANPGEIQLGDPTIGSVSNQWILPAGVGVSDAKGNYLGAIIAGFNMVRLAKRLQESITQPGVSYTVIDHDLNSLIPSTIDRDLAKIPSVLAKLDEAFASPKTSGLLYEPFPLHDTGSFILYYKTKYPYIILVSYDKKLRDSQVRQALLSYMVEFLVMGLLILALLLAIRNYILSPIMLLSAIVDNISQGKENIEFPDVKTYEMAMLSGQLQRVVHYTDRLRRTQNALNEANVQVKLANDSLEQKVIERTQALERALKVKSEFVDNISHEIRSPVQGVTIISGELVKNWDDIQEAQCFNYVSEIHRSGERLLALVNNLLDFSKMNAGKMEFAMMPRSNITEVIKGVIEEFQPLLRNKPVTLELKADTGMLAEFDRQRIGQVIRNMLSNAIKFTDRGVVTVSVRPHVLNGQEAIAVTVSDEGVGIKEEERERIFEPFTQSNRTKTRSGTGLGLMICAEIITAHQGIIYAENNREKGAALTFVIPVHHVMLLPVRRENRMLNNHNNINVLAVDDEMHCLMSMRIMLEGDGYNVIEAQGGLKALEYLNNTTERVDIILLDLMMPDMYGTDVLLALKQDERHRHIPIIIQSGVANDLEISRALQSGACTHIRKPYNRIILLDAIGMAAAQVLE